MEDGVEDVRNIVFTNGRNLEGAEETEQSKERDEAKGVINKFITNLVSGNGGGEVQEEADPDEKRGKEEENEDGGLINNLISNLVSPKLSPSNRCTDNERKANEIKKGDDIEEGRSEDKMFKSEEELDMSGGGGIINTLITNRFHQEQGGGGGEERSSTSEKKVKNAEGHEQTKREVGGNGRGGLVDNLVSNLSIPLAEDAAPATEEAAILIHSIVHD